ncbi:rab GTPase-activating protein 1-like isoform X2 [Homarus americanus]|uniref:rab GTPase-activating protein 1-like isoform X2 n=1 Tax=Homarus americanus TaxID=6706 RepID=UPI001C44F3C7|nr:rab GTPase-activating protein 1-like isoform X2 [Homarus americanus]
MEECSSLRSSDSAGTSEEYEIVESLAAQDSEPQLNIANNGNMEDLQQELTEVMREKSSESSSPNSMDSSTKFCTKKDEDSSCFSLPILETQVSQVSTLSEDACNNQDGRIDDRNLGENNPSFSQVASDDDMERVQTEDGSGDYTIFNRVTYLGAASINAPRSEAEIQRNMAILNAQAQEQALEVSVSVPSNSEGYVIIYDATTSTEMTRFKIHRILFCARGKVDTSEARCFAFTSSHGDTQETAIFQCHVFRCQIPEAVARVLITFAAAFRRVPRSKLVKKEEELCQNRQQADQSHLFDISLEIKEEDSKGNFNTVPRDKEFFKLRSSTEKQLVLTVTPAPPSTQSNTAHTNTDELAVERCFGLLVASGRRVTHADMNLLEMKMGRNENSLEESENSENGCEHGISNASHVFGVNEVQVSMGSNVNDKKSYVISGHWDPSDPVFAVLNQETPRDRRVFMTVAIDLVIRGIQEPVRFVIETKVRVYPQNERFWYFSKKPLVHLFSLKLKQFISFQVEHSPQGDQQYVVTSVDNLGEVERWRPSTMSLSLNLSSLTTSTLSSLSTGRSPSIASIETPGCDEDTDDDEPLLSGSGEVSKDCPQGELDMWRQVLPKLQAAPQQLPKGVSGLVKRGIPEALRGEVWQLLAGCSDDVDMMETYRVLITKDCASEQVILRDINRTFPAHDYFKEAGGIGQDALYKISKAYAVYDEEVGYCQGLSFLAAALLLHMPEEQTFCVLVKIMFEYGLRDLFKDGFEILHMRFYQLAKLMEEQLPELWLHFQDQGVEIHMFASQWFLTLYTAKFPLFMVFHYLDLFLLTGIDSVFQVALALLQMSKKELLSSDFEGILKYFRVSLPKKYRNEDVARQLFKIATSLKVKKLKKYEKEYLALKEQEAMQEDPVIRLERENRRLLDDNMRLERENDDLAHELVTSKINMRHSMDKLEDKCDSLNKEVKSLNSMLCDAEDEKKRLLLEANQVKELLKREVEKGDVEAHRNGAIIADYKKICSQLSERLDKEQAANTQTINMYKAKVSSCEKCSGILSPVTGPPGELGIDESPVATKLNQQVRELELELAQTKLALVESECKNQDLTHQLNTAMTELQATKSTWFQKTLTSISSLKERTASTGGIVVTSTHSSGGVGNSGLQRQHSRDSNPEKM